jgi:hypothetical protein
MTPDIDGADLVTGGGSDGRWTASGIDELGRVLSHEAVLRCVRFSGKHILTRCKTTRRKIACMDDMQWLYLDEPHDRLRWARLHWQRKNGGATTARAAAEALGMQENTYSNYERDPAKGNNRGFDHNLAIRFGRKFKISWVWILTGEGTPFDVLAPPVSVEQGKLLEMTQGRSSQDLQDVLNFVEAALRLKAG